MLNPQCRRFDVAIIVGALVVKVNNVKARGGLQADSGLSVDTLNGYFILSLRDVSFQIVIVEAFASQTELSEAHSRNLYIIESVN